MLLLLYIFCTAIKLRSTFKKRLRIFNEVFVFRLHYYADNVTILIWPEGICNESENWNWGRSRALGQVMALT